jgi:hypothetical protein
MTIETFKKLVYDLPINLNGFCDKLGLNYGKIRGKIITGNQLDVDESEIIENHFNKVFGVENEKPDIRFH